MAGPVTSTLEAPPTPASRPASRRRVVVLAAAVALAAAGVGTGVGLALGASTTAPSYGAGPASGVADPAGYDYYRTMMRGYPAGSMMGGRGGSMMGTSGYAWMTGGVNAPGWMAGDRIPGFMMGSGADPGRVMGRFWADAPGPRVSAADAARLGNQTPAGATVDAAANQVTVTGTSVQLVAVASPAPAEQRYRIAGLTNPTVVVPVGTVVSIQLVNADEDMAHGLVVTANGAATSPMPMMSAAPAFPGAAVWFLGDSTPAGMHTRTVTFTAGRAGTYQYLCPVPGHAQAGMVGSFIVR